ncbi:MAG: response regulator [Hyphomicrobiaceae bacterium]|jgi:two-component system chemotaxis response regulator CheY
MKRCVIADSSAVIRKVAKRFLEQDGWQVSETETAEETLAAVTNQSPELVLLDWQLGTTDLIETLRLRDTAHTRARIVYLTTEESRREIRAALRAGADDYMLKPFDRASFLAKLMAASGPATPAPQEHALAAPQG